MADQVIFDIGVWSVIFGIIFNNTVKPPQIYIGIFLVLKKNPKMHVSRSLHLSRRSPKLGPLGKILDVVPGSFSKTITIPIMVYTLSS